MEEQNNLKNLIVVTIIIIITLLIFYIMTTFITKKMQEKTNTINTNETVIDYDTILVSDIYKQKQSVYYVLVSMPDDDKVTDYQSDLINYSEKDNSLNVYQIDLKSAFNKNYISDNTDLTGKYPLFNATTLLKIENGQIVENYQNEDITTFLEILTNEE